MHFATTSIAILAAFSSIVSAAPAPMPNKVEERQENNVPTAVPTYTTAYNNWDLIAQLVTAPLQLDRVALLRDEDFLFNFRNPPGQVNVATGRAGRVVVANRKTFPALIGTGSAMAIGFLGPCGFNTPHVHPRATELNVPVVGSLISSMILENGVREVISNASTFQLQVFPQGAIHQEFNPDCGETIFVAAFNNEDPGTTQIADNFFRLPTSVVTASVGGNIIIDGRDVEQFRTLIPANVAIGVEECLVKCGLAKR